VSCHPGWTGTPVVSAAYSASEKKMLQPLRTAWQGAGTSTSSRARLYSMMRCICSEKWQFSKAFSLLWLWRLSCHTNVTSASLLYRPVCLILHRGHRMAMRGGTCRGSDWCVLSRWQVPHEAHSGRIFFQRGATPRTQ
jgi:hypothetical protein